MLFCQKYISSLIPVVSAQQNKHCRYRCNDSMPNQVALRVLGQRQRMRRQVRRGSEPPDFRVVLLRAPPASGLRTLELMASQQTNCTGDGDVVLLKGAGQQSHLVQHLAEPTLLW